MSVISKKMLEVASTSTESMLNSLNIFGRDIGASDMDPRFIATNIIRISISFIGLILVLMILSGGVQFLFSGGDKAKVTSAKKTLINAVIGLFIILSANSIVTFVMNAVQTNGN